MTGKGRKKSGAGSAQAPSAPGGGVASGKRRAPVVREAAAVLEGVGPKVRKNYLLPQALIDAARKALGKPTETETIEEALRLAIFSQQLAAGAESVLGYPWQDPFGEEQPMEPNEAP